MAIEDAVRKLERELSAVDKEMQPFLETRTKILNALAALGSPVEDRIGVPEEEAAVAPPQPKRSKASPSPDKRVRNAPVHRYSTEKLEQICWDAVCRLHKNKKKRFTNYDVGVQARKTMRDNHEDAERYWHSSMGRILRKFWESGLMTRDSAPGDAALYAYSLTDKGLALIDAQNAAAQQEQPVVQKPAPVTDTAPELRSRPVLNKVVEYLKSHRFPQFTAPHLTNVLGINGGDVHRVLEWMKYPDNGYIEVAGSTRNASGRNMNTYRVTNKFREEFGPMTIRAGEGVITPR